MVKISSILAMACMAALWVAPANAATTLYTSEAAFVADIQPDFYLENFDAYTYGSYTEWTLPLGPVNGYSYTISTGPGAVSYLWSGYGDMSTNNAEDPLVVDFTGKEVTAVGGNFYGSDIDGNWMAATVTIDLSDGTQYSYSNTSQGDFRGFIADVPIVSMSIDAPDDEVNSVYVWSTMDNFYVGTPEPAAASMLILGGLALIRRRRRA